MEQFNEQLSDLGRIQAKKVISRAGFSLFVMAVITLVSQILLEILTKKFYPAATKSDWYEWALTGVTVIGIGLPTFYLIIRTIPDSPKGEVVKLSPLQFITIFFICVAAMYITNYLSGILTMVIASLKGEKDLVNPVAEAMLNSNFILSLIYATIAAPIAEELIFRKMLLNKLRRFGDTPAILMTGIAFGLYHMNLVQFFYAAVLGCIFAYVTIKTNTILYSIFLHMSINFIGTIITPFATSGRVIVTLLLGQWVLICIVVGVVLFIINAKNIKLERSEIILPKKSDYIINAGTILYLLVCFVMIGVMTIAS